MNKLATYLLIGVVLVPLAVAAQRPVAPIDPADRLDKLTDETNQKAQARIDEFTCVRAMSKENAICPNDGIATQKLRTSAVLFSVPALNRLFAKRLAYYLSGTDDLSLFRDYFVANTAEGTATVAHNFANPDDKPEERIRSVGTLGAKVAVFRGAFNRNFNGFDRQIALFGRWTVVGRGRVFYCIDQSRDLIAFRNDLRTLLKRQLRQEQNDFDAEHRDLTSAAVQKKAAKFRTSLYEKYIHEFADQEADNADYNVLRNHWLTFGGNLPLAANPVRVLPAPADSVPVIYRYWPVSVSVLYGWFRENQRQHVNLLVTAEATLVADNPVNYLAAWGYFSNTVATRLDLVEEPKAGDSPAYRGDYQQFTALKFRPQVVLGFTKPPAWMKHVGQIALDLGGDFTLVGQVPVQNLKAGLLLSLTGKEKGTPVNANFVFTFNDLSRTLITDASFGRRITVGLKVGLPFNSILN